MTTITPSEGTFLLGSTYISGVDLGDDETRAAQVEFSVGGVGLTKFCVAAAFAALAEEGSIGLEFVEEKKLKFLTTRHVVATVCDETGFPAGSLEREFFQSIGGRSTGVGTSSGVELVVERWFGKDVRKPYDVLMEVPRKRLVDLGLLEETEPEVERGRISSSLLGKTKAVREPNRELIAAKVGEMQAVARAWQGFKESHAEVSSKIFEDIGLAIKVRTQKDR
jgi:hypothetical protein